MEVEADLMPECCTSARRFGAVIIQMPMKELLSSMEQAFFIRYLRLVLMYLPYRIIRLVELRRLRQEEQ